MTYEELVEQVRERTGKKDASKITDHMAIQFNVEGEAEGAFYIEVYLGHIVVEPYEYYDHDILIAASYPNILDILDGKMDPVKAQQEGAIHVEGNTGRLALFGEIIDKTPEKKAKKPAAKKTTAEKKPAAKKTATTAKKTTTAAKKTTTAAKKTTTAAKKTTAAEKKPAAKKTTTKKA